VPVLALMYHDVVAGDPDTSGFQGAGPNHYKVPAPLFASHLDAIDGCGLAPTLVGGPAGDVRLLLTFDDGGLSAAGETAPLLERRGWRGHFFITTARIGTPGFLDRSQLLTLHEAGHVVASHAHTHRPLPGLTDDDIRREWKESKVVLEDLLGASVTVASVPTGRYSARVGGLAAEAGYDHVFTCEPWLEPRRAGSALVYGRYPVYSGTSTGRISALCSLSRPTLVWMGGGWYARKAAKSVLGPLYDPLRRRVLARIG
jgi:peptidoglycan/xylan/chitin deacetylase (PgdA/CDA1 family)